MKVSKVPSATLQIRSSLRRATIFRHMRGFAMAKLSEIYTANVEMRSEHPENLTSKFVPSVHAYVDA